MTFLLSEWKDVISNFAVLSNFVQFLSGVLVCRHYVNNKSTSDSSPLPFITGFLSCSLWLQYGLNRQDENIIRVNIVGTLLFLSYVVVFIYYTFKKTNVIKQLLAVVIFILLVMSYGKYEPDKQLYVERLGLLACCLTLIFIAAPLTKLYYVIRVKNTACLPFPMIFMSFMVSLFWLLYGIIIEDPYLQLPNLIGATLAAFQLSVFLIYPAVPKSPVPIDKTSMNL